MFPLYFLTSEAMKILLFIFLLPTLAHCAPNVSSVHDGDTLTALTWHGTTQKIRLNGIDAPELTGDQDQASAASNETGALSLAPTRARMSWAQ